MARSFSQNFGAQEQAEPSEVATQPQQTVQQQDVATSGPVESEDRQQQAAWRGQMAQKRADIAKKKKQAAAKKKQEKSLAKAATGGSVGDIAKAGLKKGWQRIVVWLMGLTWPVWLKVFIIIVIAITLIGVVLFLTLKYPTLSKIALWFGGTGLKFFGLIAPKLFF